MHGKPLEARSPMITHVAIRFQGRVWSLPKPNRHHDVIRHIVHETDVDTVDAHGSDQGFLAETGEYMTRWQALRYAIHCGKVPKEKLARRELFSEDVW